MIDHPYFKWLDAVQSPSQYVGNEVHSVIKEKDGVDCRVALCFPELYKIGMSHLGLKILYSILNKHPKLWAERFFAPEPDFEKILRDAGEPIRSLESHDPLKVFDIVGFSISTELCYTGILTILDLGGIPLKQVDRKEDDPIVIGGGASVFNPEPVADFFDIFVLGEAEELLPTLALKTAEYKKAGLKRTEILKKLAQLEGIYVPSLFDVEYEGKTIKSITPQSPEIKNPKRVFLPTLSESPFPHDMVIPYGHPVFDRLSVEIDRGCTGGCRFCQAGITYRPVRERDPKEVLSLIEKSLKSTGFDEVSLASLSSGDYGNIEPLVTSLVDNTEESHVSVSLPSLRSGTLTEGLISQIARVRKTGFTITAEAGTERLRRVINKKITDAQIIETAQKVLDGGWRRLKLYFMIGLPTETDEDIDAIIKRVDQIRKLERNGRRFMKVNVGVSQFVPKSHTPFQWVAMDDQENLLRKKKLILSAFQRIKAVSIKGHEVEMSYIEGLFSRGDRRLSKVILGAYEKGCRLDGWTENFRLGLWLEAFSESGFGDVTTDDFALRERGKDEILPWEHLDIGVSKKYLLREMSHADSAETTEDCRTDSCLGCGLDHRQKNLAEPMSLPAKTNNPASDPRRYKYRFGFRKEGTSCYLSHLDMMAAFLRAIRRAGLRVAYSQGLHPRPKVSYSSALPVGLISLCEMIDIELVEERNPNSIKDLLNKELECGLSIQSGARIYPPFKSIQSQMERTIYEITDSSTDLKPSLDEVIKVLDNMDAASDINFPEGSMTLRFEFALEGILSKLKKALPGFALTGDRRLIKCGVILKSDKTHKSRPLTLHGKQED